MCFFSKPELEEHLKRVQKSDPENKRIFGANSRVLEMAN